MDNNITMTKEEEFIIEIITKYVVPIMFSIIVLTGCIGNILVIYVVSFHLFVFLFQFYITFYYQPTTTYVFVEMTKNGIN